MLDILNKFTRKILGKIKELKGKMYVDLYGVILSTQKKCKRAQLTSAGQRTYVTLSRVNLAVSDRIVE